MLSATLRQESIVQQSNRNTWWAGAYPLLLAMMLGATWLDRMYSRALEAAGSAGSAPRNVSDLLLLRAAMTVLAGLIAACLWQGRARILCVASLIVFCLEFVLPALVRAVP